MVTSLGLSLGLFPRLAKLLDDLPYTYTSVCSWLLCSGNVEQDHM